MYYFCVVRSWPKDRDETDVISPSKKRIISQYLEYSRLHVLTRTGVQYEFIKNEKARGSTFFIPNDFTFSLELFYTVSLSPDDIVFPFVKQTITKIIIIIKQRWNVSVWKLFSYLFTYLITIPIEA